MQSHWRAMLTMRKKIRVLSDNRPQRPDGKPSESSLRKIRDLQERMMQKVFYDRFIGVTTLACDRL